MSDPWGNMNRYTPAGAFKPVSRWFRYTLVVALVSVASLCIIFSSMTVFNQQERVKMGVASKLSSMQSTLDSMTLRLDAKDLEIAEYRTATLGVRIALETCLGGKP